LNAFAERFVRSIKEEYLSRMIFFGTASLQHAVRQFIAHYHTERNHQGLENRFCSPDSSLPYPVTLFNADSASEEC
jgi:transposase InsO family protein